jgi:hypothetical protein
MKSLTMQTDVRNVFSYTEYRLNIYQVKVKFTLGQTMKAQRGD